MQQVLSVWSALDTRRRIIVILATLAMFAAVLGVSRLATQPSMALLYSGLEAGAAGEVVAALDAQGVQHEVRGTSIFVDSARRDELRLSLASQGLPAETTQGYELLDTLSGFGTTSQMFDAAYWRAKEGELARTIVANPKIQAARVHIASGANQPFRRAEERTASVTVTTRGETLGNGTAKALKYLVASAVSGLSPDNVAIIDSRSGIVLGGDELDPAANGAERAAKLQHNVERLLEARVGAGNAVVEVSVETVTQRESIVEKRFDPTERVAISTESEESRRQSNEAEDGAVTVASNLPDGDANAGDGTSSSNSTETRERANYEVSQTQREVLRVPGAIKRISVAVLVDGVRAATEAGETTWAPRPEEELAALRELVASAVGFDEARGDTITLKSMEFLPTPELGTTATSPRFGAMQLDLMSLIQLGVLAIVALILGLFVIRPILAARAAAGPAVRALEGPREPAIDMVAEPRALQMPDGEFSPSTANAIAVFDGSGAGPTPSGDSSDAVGRLRRMIEDRREETVGVLRSWMEEERA